jgi:hypothetical protein
VLLSKTYSEYLSDAVASLRYLLTIGSDYFLLNGRAVTRLSDMAKSAATSILSRLRLELEMLDDITAGTCERRFACNCQQGKGFGH